MDKKTLAAYLLAAAGWINTFALSWLMILNVVTWWPNVLFLFLFLCIAVLVSVNLAYPNKK